MLKLNETPVRTAKNFRINNIEINEKIPTKIKEFKSLETICEDTKVRLTDNTSPIDLSYGLGNDLIEQVKENANVRIKAEINSKTNRELQFNFNFDNSNNNLIEDIEIDANEDTKETVIIKYVSREVDSYHNGIIRVNAKKNSNLTIVVVNLLNDNSNNFLSIQNNIEEEAKVNYCIVDFGGKNSITNYYSNIIGKNADNQLNTIYLGNKNQVFDLNYIAELRGEKSNVSIEVQGALKDNAKKNFKGTIDFKRGCKKATGNENENCMLLSDTAKSIALPMLLCSEEDVEGNHSSSAGKADGKELFYIMSRGFDYKAAMKLLVRARFNKILESIKNQALKNEILYEIDKRLD
jgi:Fe-S cluster assembly scaffold protein SufB